jgi:D-3-phosphoglycerate dehydrogenase
VEAQETVGIEVARSIRDYLIDGAIVNSVNMPSIDEQTMKEIGPYLSFAEALGRILSQIAPAQSEVIRVNYYGKIGDIDTALISRAALKGYLEMACDAGSVNQINAPGVAESMGLRFTESHLPTPGEFTDMIEVSAKAGDATATVGGTFFGHRPRIVRINDRRVEASPEGYLLVIENRDEPGLVGEVGTLLGRHSVNIANMSLNRKDRGTTAFTLLNLDTEVAEDVLRELERLPAVISARQIRT